MSKITTTYFEDLTIEGQSCPPEDVLMPDGQKEYFRVLRSNPPTSDCFISHRLRFPDREFNDECEARSVSLSDSLEGLINGYFRTQAGKGKKYAVGVLKLQHTDGHVKQTGAKSHHSWWRSNTFDITTVTIQEIQR